jgi:hypothetical protein
MVRGGREDKAEEVHVHLIWLGVTKQGGRRGI